MMPRWAFGLWQCRERYRTAAESVDGARRVPQARHPRRRHRAGLAVLAPERMGLARVRPGALPRSGALGRATSTTAHARADDLRVAEVLSRHGQLQGARRGAAPSTSRTSSRASRTGSKNVFTFYDAFNPAARALYWSQIKHALFTKGIDAWWMDVSEPEAVEGPFPTPAAQVEAYQTHMNPTALGSGARVLNAYPLVNSQASTRGSARRRPTSASSS